MPLCSHMALLLALQCHMSLSHSDLHQTLTKFHPCPPLTLAHTLALTLALTNVPSFQ